MDQKSNGNQPKTPNVGNVERSVSTIAGLALGVYGLKQRTSKGLALAGLGGALIYRGATGACQVYDLLGISSARSSGEVAREAHVEKAITVGCSASELFKFWRDFQNLPTFMLAVESVETIDDKHSHWKVNVLGSTYEWDAEIFNEKQDELIAWRSIGAAEVVNAGVVRFQPLRGNRGTRVQITFNFNPPGGKLTAALLKLLGDQPGRVVERDLRRFKQLMETGEIATIEGQTSGRAPSAHPVDETLALAEAEQEGSQSRAA
jgi:uncharacterized membrane protein